MPLVGNPAELRSLSERTWEDAVHILWMKICPG